MQSHDSLLADSLLLMAQELNDLRQDSRNCLLVDKLAHSRERSADNKVVVRPQIFLNSVNYQYYEVVVLVEEECDGEIARALEQERIIMRHLDGMNVAE